MIGNGSTLRVTDNSGARLVQCINQTGRSFGVGDLITVAVKKAVKGKVAAGTVIHLLTITLIKWCFSHHSFVRKVLPVLVFLSKFEVRGLSKS